MKRAMDASPPGVFDVAVLGGGFAGFSTALRLQAEGWSTVVLERHGQVGGCAGFFRRAGFAFDVGATTLVDFGPGGVGGELLESTGLTADAEQLAGYVAWLPDRRVQLFRDAAAWRAERLDRLGASTAHVRFWRLMDTLADVFWAASRRGVRLPIRGPLEAIRAASTLGLRHLPLARFLGWTLGDALTEFGLRQDRPLCALLSMLVEDTVHGRLDTAPLINSALGVTIRGAGLWRCRGGMWGFWRRAVARYRELGGVLKVGTRALQVTGAEGAFAVRSSRGVVRARHVVSALPADLTAQVVPALGEALSPWRKRDAAAHGGALVLLLGVPEAEVSAQEWTHHQVLVDCEAPLGDGNNAFISVSSPRDTDSAPPGFRAVMVSTHCELGPWRGLDEAAYAARKAASTRRLLSVARRVYPSLAAQPMVMELGTPRTYATYTGRIDGAVGGVRQTLKNSNQHALPYAPGPAGLFMVGDSTWPGLGTVACALGSRHVAKSVAASLGSPATPQLKAVETGGAL